jgi:hypothetical protein
LINSYLRAFFLHFVRPRFISSHFVDNLSRWRNCWHSCLSSFALVGVSVPICLCSISSSDQREHKICTEHNASKLVVTLMSSCSSDERLYGMNRFGPFKSGVSYFAYALVKILERHNGAITHSHLIEEISNFLIDFNNRMVIEERLSDQCLWNTCHHPSLLCADSQPETTFLRLWYIFSRDECNSLLSNNYLIFSFMKTKSGWFGYYSFFAIS